MDLTSLDQFKASDLLATAVDNVGGTPRQVALDAIDFDAQQPRRRLNMTALQALADTIALHGVLEPVSLRTHGDKEARFIVNRGERRVRASRLAGLVAIPAFVDERIDPYAQVIENEHREDLTLFDLATFVVERESAGESRAEIARRLGKPRSLITELASLKAASPEVQAACKAGRIADSRGLYLLARTDPQAAPSVAALLDGAHAISRGSVEQVLAATADSLGAATAGLTPPTRRSASRAAAPSLALLVEVDGCAGRLLWRRADAAGHGEVVFADGGRRTVRLSELRLLEWGSELCTTDS